MSPGPIKDAFSASYFKFCRTRQRDLVKNSWPPPPPPTHAPGRSLQSRADAGSSSSRAAMLAQAWQRKPKGQPKPFKVTKDTPICFLDQNGKPRATLVQISYRYPVWPCYYGSCNDVRCRSRFASDSASHVSAARLNEILGRPSAFRMLEA